MKVYRKNEKMDFIRTDEYATAVFDPDSGCTHLVNDTGTGILDALDEPCNIREMCIRDSPYYGAFGARSKKSRQIKKGHDNIIIMKKRR